MYRSGGLLEEKRQVNQLAQRNDLGRAKVNAMNVDALVALEVELLDLIFSLNPLVWRRFQQHGRGSTGSMWCPFVAFRFSREDASVTKELRQAVQTFQGTIAWTLFGHEREGLPGINWVIAPVQLLEAKDRASSVLASASDYLSQENPSLVSAACHEFASLVEHIRLCVVA